MDQITALLSLSYLTSASDVFDWLIGIPGAIFHGYSWLIRSGADGVHWLFDNYGYWAVFLGTLSENTLLVGLIVPGSFVIVLAGLAVQEGSMSLPLALVLGVAGTIMGDTISYFLGQFGWARIKFLRDNTERVREPLLRRGMSFVLFYHFAGYTRVVGPAAAGLMRMPFHRWAIADYGGAVLWVSSYVAIGWVLGRAGFTFDSSDRYFHYIEWGFLAVVLVMFFFFYRATMRTWFAFQYEAKLREALEAERVDAATPE
jgi:membrane protein DedA with SNARE-associated domain